MVSVAPYVLGKSTDRLLLIDLAELGMLQMLLVISRDLHSHKTAKGFLDIAFESGS